MSNQPTDPANSLETVTGAASEPAVTDQAMKEHATPDAPTPASNPAQQRQRAIHLAQAIRHELQKALIGQDAVIDDVLTALIGGGHVLLEGVPGLGKTLLVRALARCFGGEFARTRRGEDFVIVFGSLNWRGSRCHGNLFG